MTHSSGKTPRTPAGQVPPTYLEATGVTTLFHLADLMHGNIMNIVKDELVRLKVEDINPVQAVFLYRMGDQVLKPTEFRARGVYLGSNASYNVKRLVAAGYLDKRLSTTSRRGVAYRLTDKGHVIEQAIQSLSDRLMAVVLKQLKVSETTVTEATTLLEKIDTIIAGQIRHIW